jgi:RNA recognition motif-containing protein
MDIHVGSIPFKWKEAQLREIFEAYGEVTSATIIIDKITRQNKGFGFVEMPKVGEAYRAIKALNGAEMEGRKITVSVSEGKKDADKKGGQREGSRKKGGTDRREDRRK